MEASINSRDDENHRSRGKTYRVRATEFKVWSIGSNVSLQAEEVEFTPTTYPLGDTPPREVHRIFTLHLNPSEVKRIVDVALSKGLLHSEVVVSSKRKPNKRKVKKT